MSASFTPVSVQAAGFTDQQPGHDWMLARVIAFADNYRIEQSITLFCGGVIISGIVISGREYCRGLAETVRGYPVFGGKEAGDGPLLTAVMAEAYRRFEAEYPPFELESEDPPRFPDHIHLRDARIVTPGQSPKPPEGMLWRGKMTAVDGFTLSRLE